MNAAPVKRAGCQFHGEWNRFADDACPDCLRRAFDRAIDRLAGLTEMSHWQIANAGKFAERIGNDSVRRIQQPTLEENTNASTVASAAL